MRGAPYSHMRAPVVIAFLLLSVTVGPAQPARAEIPPSPCPACIDVVLDMSDSPDPVPAGSELTYSINLWNTGPGIAFGVTLRDEIPANTTFVSFEDRSRSPGNVLVTTPPPGGRGGVTATIPTFRPSYQGDIRLFVLTVKVAADAADGSTITNTATATAAGDPTPQNNTATTTTVVERPTLSLSIADGPDPVYAGQSGASRGGGLTYSITVTNESASSDAHDVTISDVVPANTTFGGWIQESGPAFALTAPPNKSAGAVTATIGSLAPGTSAAFRLLVDVDCGARDGTAIINTVNVSWSTAAGTRGASATATTLVATLANIGFTYVNAEGPVAAGGDLTYEWTVGSEGPSDSQNVTFRDDIPAHATFVSFSQVSGPAATLTTLPDGGTGTVTAVIPTLPCWMSASFRLVVNVDPDTAAGTVISNTATVTASTRDPNGGGYYRNSVTTSTNVTAFAADLVVSLTDAPDPVQAGNDVRYDIGVINNGPDQATNISLWDQVPFKTSFVSFSQTGGPAFTLTSPSYGQGSVTAQGVLASGESASFTLVVRVDPGTAAGTLISDSAQVKSYDAYDPARANNIASATTDVVAAPPP
jgi:uncharacterized repeat protein (TIGR01451 family)